MKEKKYLSAAIALAIMAAGSSVFAADVVDFGDEEVIVTATRTEKKDVDVPAGTEIVTADKIKEMGVRSAMDVLKQLNGIQYDCIGNANSNMGTMTNDVIIRGYKDGTLILINGTPMEYRGKYDLGSIDARNIERIEVIKGNGSTLYGSDAIGGVVNIILKKNTQENTVTVGFGNREGYNYGVNVGSGNWRVGYYKSMLGKSFDQCTPNINKDAKNAELRYYTRDLSKENFNISGSLNDKWDIYYNFSENMGYYDRYITATLPGYTGKAKVGDLYQTRRYDTTNHNFQAVFHDKDWKVSIFNNLNFIESRGVTNKLNYAGTPYHTREKNVSYGADVQKKWYLNNSTNLIAGISGQREIYNAYITTDTKKNIISSKNSSFGRNVWAAFTQIEHQFDAKNTATFGARETWTTGAYRDQNYNNFSMSGSWLHKMNEENNLYLSIAQSFKMPTYSEMNKNTDFAIPNPDLKPAKGINYEIGWKQNHGSHTWKAALFHIDVEDNITASWDTKKKYYQYTNVDFRNTGIELSCKIDGGDKWSYNYGITWQHPQSKSDNAKKLQMRNQWENVYGRLQLDGGIGYKYKKFKTNLNFTYMCSRYQSQSGPNEAVKPYLLSNWNFIYTPDEHSEFNLNIENVLNRRDRTSNSSSDYFCAPTTFMLNYTYKF
ncbi:iron complex outermembrane recepter protein [Anaerovibrio lipolyticus DSM 3074]|uniref:TonB-dependent receptor n=2 Tax=Anaerovibrio lipolyticus TaxID=82374 RepID=A0A0B2K052_9FIRM|nr:TonB-dependent receptor [Anaerovibrio lipolyticus]KHM51587.1 hypothetical protein NZ47_09890 [Anaerovibrio lipolyticus]SHI68868.1 iron complex outermembrane recepter protein [Anaerovibrio lipolyticus DSM 3074]